MKRIYYFNSVLVLLFIGMLCACSESESKQYEKVKKSKSVALIDQYLVKFPDAPAAHLDTINMLRVNLIDDSLAYAKIISTTDAMERVELDKRYIEDHKDGLYIEKVKQMLVKDQKAAEEHQKKLEAERREAIKKMTVGELIENELLKQISFVVDYKYVSYRIGCRNLYTVKLDMQSGSAEVNVKTMLRAYKEAPYETESDDTYYGHWSTVYAPRGSRSVPGVDIECGQIEIYATEEFSTAYINQIDRDAYWNFRNGNNVNAPKISSFKMTYLDEDLMKGE